MYEGLRTLVATGKSVWNANALHNGLKRHRIISCAMPDLMACGIDLVLQPWLQREESSQETSDKHDAHRNCAKHLVRTEIDLRHELQADKRRLRSNEVLCNLDVGTQAVILHLMCTARWDHHQVSLQPKSLALKQVGRQAMWTVDRQAASGLCDHVRM